MRTRRAPSDLVVVRGNGYDGQFYYRLALDPADLARRAFGIELDSASRLGRIGYPALAWLLSGGGRPFLVPAALVLANLIGLGILGWSGARVALDSGRHALWGLVAPAYWGYLWSLGRDLTEILAAALLTGLVAVRHHQWLLVGLLVAAHHYLAALPTTAALLWCGELAVMVVVVVSAARTLRQTSAPVHERVIHERVIWAGAVLLAAPVAAGDHRRRLGRPLCRAGAVRVGGAGTEADPGTRCAFGITGRDEGGRRVLGSNRPRTSRPR